MAILLTYFLNKIKIGRKNKKKESRKNQTFIHVLLFVYYSFVYYSFSYWIVMFVLKRVTNIDKK